MAESEPREARELLELLYAELRRQAEHEMRKEKPGQTIQATALVHEAYLRLAGKDSGARWSSRSHFFAAAAEAMRHILVDVARRKRRLKHGGGRVRKEIEEEGPPAPLQPFEERLELTEDLLELDKALDRLAAQDPRKAELVKRRYFTGQTIEGAAEDLGISVATAKRDWTYARAWLRQHMSSSSTTPPAEPA
jgi:RNA polymerase sigma factor (TIGR02999 family)